MVNTAAGKAGGTINDTGLDSVLYFENTQTFNNATINLGSMDFSVSSQLDVTGAGTLTLGSGVTIDVSGGAEIYTGGSTGDGIVNQGTISQTASGSFSSLPASSLTNSGTITAGSHGGTLTIEPATFTNNGAIDISDESVTIALPKTFTNSGTITVASPGARGLTIEGLGEFTNSGTLTVSNEDTVDIETDGVTGRGTDTISGASTLEFGSAVSSSTTVGSQNIGFAGGGTLDLTDPTSFYGEVSGFATGDTIELEGSWDFSGISQAGGVTTLTLVMGSTTHAFEFVGDYAQGDFKITSGATSTITHT